MSRNVGWVGIVVQVFEGSNVYYYSRSIDCILVYNCQSHLEIATY